MTEAEWLATPDVMVLMIHLPDHVSARKIRLAVCGCLRSPKVWPHLVSICSHRALELSEKLAEGSIKPHELQKARRGAHAAWSRIGPLKPFEYAAAELANNACFVDSMMLRAAPWAVGDLARRQPHAVPIGVLRDVFGNPFQPVAFAPAWRTTDVTLLANGIYSEREFDRMPILADALQDAGCDAENLLAHLRDTTATHVRGCWALDLVLGK